MMNTTNILAFSSSRVAGGGYLEAAAPVIQKFLGTTQRHTIAFIPFASVDAYEAYETSVRQGLPAFSNNLKTATTENAKDLLQQSTAIIIGGGNTFKLLRDLYALNLVEMIKAKVQAGTPYIGWSAGSNLTGPTLCTTNDMPVVQPKSFDAFGFFPFQINPHYSNVVIKGFHGETRDQRLEEYLKMNEGKSIMCLPEGTWLQLQNGQLLFDGIADGVVMTREEGQTIHRRIHPGTALSSNPKATRIF